MARASTKALLGCMVCVALGGMAPAVMPFGLTAVAVAQGQANPALVSGALRSGIESYRSGNYEQADIYLRQASAGADSLSPKDRKDLADNLQLNNTALQNRRRGAEQLKQAEAAQREGRTSEALSLIAALKANADLTSADRQQAMVLEEQLRPTAAQGTDDPSRAAFARSKLSQARDYLNNGDFSHAEALAREVLQLAMVWRASEDHPGKVLQDIEKIRKDWKLLLGLGRKALKRNDLDAAERLGHDSEKQCGLKIWPFGDSPSKLLRDVQAARLAVKSPNAAPSKERATQSDKNKINLNSVANESTEVAVADGAEAATAEAVGVKIASAETASTKAVGTDDLPTTPALVIMRGVSPDTPPPPAATRTSIPNDDAHQLLRKARKALAEGRVADAKQLVVKAQAIPTTYFWWDTDTPERVSADIQRAETKGPSKAVPPGGAVPPNSTTPPIRVAVQTNVAPPKQPVSQTQSVQPGAPAAGKTVAANVRKSTHSAPQLTKKDAEAMVKRARTLMASGQMEEAEDLMCTAREAVPAGWGLFEDSPDKVTLDLRKAREKKQCASAEILLAKGREAFKQGRLKEAGELAIQAQKLHGRQYSFWDLGDRPEKLLNEVRVAEAKNRKMTLPPMTTPKLAGASETKVAQVNPSRSNANKPVAADPLASASGSGPRPLGNENLNLKSAVPAPAPTPTASANVPPAAGPNAGMAAPRDGSSKPMDQAARAKVEMLLAEAQRLQDGGQLAEARQKVLEAQKLGVVFAPDEHSPERALIELAGLATRCVDLLQQKAADALNGFNDPAHCRIAEEYLGQAKQIAVTFGFDVIPIERRLAAIAQLQRQPGTDVAATPPVNPAVPLPVPVPVAPASDLSMQQGLVLLEQAKVEISKGNNSGARHMAVDACRIPSVQAQAMEVLRSIDAEEAKQHRLQVVHSFDAALSAYHRNDVAQARGILAVIDPTLLDREQLVRYKEIMQMPEMQPSALSQVAVKPSVAGNDQAGHAQASDGPGGPMPSGDNFLQSFTAMQEIQFQKLRTDGMEAQRKALERFRGNEPDQAFEILQAYLDTLNTSKLDAQHLAMLKRPIDARLETLRGLNETNKRYQVASREAKTIDGLMREKYTAEKLKQQKVSEQMQLYHDLYRKGKYREAELAALKARELDPDNVAADAAIELSRMHHNLVVARNLKQGKWDITLDALNDTDDEGPYVGIMGEKGPVKFDDKYWRETVSKRQPGKQFNDSMLRPEREQEILRRLTQPISLHFSNTTLQRIVDQLTDLSGVNVVADTGALNEAGISLDLPLSLNLDNVSMKSALNVLLDQAKLTYVVKNEVLNITTLKAARGKQEKRTYQVADLVVPIDNYTVGGHADLPTVIDKLNRQSSGFSTGITPYTGWMTLPNGQGVGQPGNGTVSPGQMVGKSMLASGNSLPEVGPSPARPGRVAGQTMEETLIRLITNTIAPDSWSDMGGPGTIDYFPLGMALVVNQTPDIQEQIGELLAALRRLQDVEVAIEVRFITISESFYERIGVNFDVNVLADTAKYQPQIVSGAFNQPGYINSFQPSKFVAGLTPAGTFTNDLNIPITTSSFGPAVPQFGGFPSAPGADGGLSLGLAFLSDIQVFLFLDAAQGDRRTNVMQAPKLTMFNAQTATILVQDTTFFVTGNIIGLFNGQVVYSPQNQPFNIGLALTMQPVVSADRRFVRVSLAPTLTNIQTPLAALFPFTTVITPTFDTGVQGQPVPITQYIQQPAFTTVGVQTTVSVPDGGTVLLGGLKTLREARNEFGPPVLSKIPYINRLFRNQAYGRDAESLMLMVTPRIIINEEEEERATGLRNGVAGGG